MPTSIRPRNLVFAATLLLLGNSTLAYAQDADPAMRAAARDLGYEGVQAYQAGDLATAIDRLRRAFQVVKAPTLGLWLARSLRDQGKLVEASELFLEVTRLTATGGDEAVQQQAQKDAKIEYDALKPRLARLTVIVTGPHADEVTVTVDERTIPKALLSVPSPTNPGKHVLRVNRANGTVLTREVSLAEGATETVELEMTEGTPVTGVAATNPANSAAISPARGTQRSAKPQTTTAAPAPVPASKPAVPRWIGYTALAVGGLGLVTGGAVGLKARADRKELIDQGDCNENNDCSSSPEVVNDVNAYNRLRSASIVGVGVGVLGLATGAILLWALPSSKTKEKPIAFDWVTTPHHQQINVSLSF